MNMAAVCATTIPADILAFIFGEHFARRRPQAPFNPFQFYIDNRQECTPVVCDESPREARQCMTNSFHAVSDYLCRGMEAYYVEGYLLIDNFPLTPHGLVEFIDGERRFVEVTMEDFLSHHSFFGLRVPNELLLKCCEHPAWTLSVGCIETMSHFSDQDLEWAKGVWEESFNA